MMNHSTTPILTDVQELTPQWLSACLGRTFQLGNNRVVGIEVVDTRITRISSAYFLQIRYAEPNDSYPARLFLKLPVSGKSLDREEVEFYKVLVPEMAPAFAGHLSPFIQCFDAVYSASPEGSHLLLADMSLTHFTNPALMPPTVELCHAIIDSYARFHAFWWEHPWLGKQVGRYLTDAVIDEYIQNAQTKWLALQEVVEDKLTLHQQSVLAAVARTWPARRRERVLAGQGVTVVHRDPHPLNFLYPYDLAVDSVKLIDWQSWRVDTGTDDLAYLMACHWPLTDQPDMEETMLMRYLQRLEAAGVHSYGWKELSYDYRASIIRCLFFLLVAWSPTHWAGDGWRNRVTRGIEAFDRFDCGALLS